MSLPYNFQSSGRRPATMITLALVWALIGVCVIWLDASLIIAGIFAVVTLPAAYDLIQNPQSSLTLDATHLRWNTPRQSAEIALSEIDHLRFDTRLDMSVRLTVVRPSGVKIRVPYPATPPHRVFEPLATKAGLKTMRQHFSLMG